MYLDKVLVYGNLGKDPELRALPNGTNVANFSIATTRVYYDKDKNKQEQTDWHNIVVFGRQADLVAQYLKKGSSVLIEGRMQTRSWEQDGVKKYRTEVIAEKMQFGPKAGNTAGGATFKGEEAAEPKSTGGQSPAPAGIEYPEEDINPDDIPF